MWDDLGRQPEGWLYPVYANSETGLDDATSLDLRLTFNSYPLTRRLAGRLSFFGTLDQQIPGGIDEES